LTAIPPGLVSFCKILDALQEFLKVFMDLVSLLLHDGFLVILIGSAEPIPPQSLMPVITVITVITVELAVDASASLVKCFRQLGAIPKPLVRAM
jgi:hypothetical protein